MKILIGLSGGLDSTYAAYLLKQEGHDVIGASVIMHKHTDTKAAKEAAEIIGIPYVEINKSADFDSIVVKNFIDEYCNGRTPNPCVICNRYVKFDALCEYANENGFDCVSTGHYSSIEKENDRYFIRKADDAEKDQSYVLWRLSQSQLSMLYLPLSGMKKQEIKEKARCLGFSAADAPESQENCFIPDNDYVSFIKNNSDKIFPEGNFIDKNGVKLGKHKGLINYTVGQRKGLGVSFGEPRFVASLNPFENSITLVRSGEEYFSSMTVNELNFMKLSPDHKLKTISATVKVRYSARPINCEITFEEESVAVAFEMPQRAVTPGQSAVFYHNNDVLFGGIITSSKLK